MHLVKLNRILHKFPIKYRLLSTVLNEEYTEIPQYPPIIKLDLKSRKERDTQEWSQKIQDLKTVEEKQMKLNMPRYYGWKTIILNDKLIPYNSMHFVQHCTRTHFRQTADLCDFYKNIHVDDNVRELKSLVEEILVLEYNGINRNQNKLDGLDKATAENILSDSIVEKINRAVFSVLSSTNHLADTQIDFSPRHEAFWFVGGIDPPETARNARNKVKWLKDRADDPINKAVQYLGKPSVAIRSDLPLEPILPYEESNNPSLDVPFYKFDPRVLGFNSTNRHGTNIPGFWPGDSYEFGLLSFQNRGHLLNRSQTFGEKDNIEALHSHGIMSSFAWLLSQANFQGFTTYNDLTYPLVTQTVITNGQEWSFYTYQLNTIVMHSDIVSTNTKRNICWGSKPEKLFQEIQDGKVIGLNDNILKYLLKYYSNVPKNRAFNMKPYLGETESIVADITNDEKRDWLEKQYKHMMSNRPRHRPLYEIYHWEKIYKIDHKTRTLDARRRPFELETNPWNRKYDERAPSYIPKALRPGGPKSKPKFYKNYYP